MPERKITTIPATKLPVHKAGGAAARKRRVAAYARVSTDSEEQLTSYEAQVDYYTDYIGRHPEWEFVRVYTDEGISGLGTKKREGFNQMISDALAGTIDLIVTKSVSRFARNTVDSLVTIRKLKEHNVEVFFEKENIMTFDGKGELLITIMSSIAQEESRSISENVTWGQRKRFSDGKVSVSYKNFLGYDKSDDPDLDDPLVVNPEQAVLVRRIYRMFMEGMSVCTIANQLKEEGVPTPAGKKCWGSKTIESILTNEKYKGAALLQKCFTVDFLTKKQKKNEGEVPQYYIENSHEAIIDPVEWEAVQEEMARRKQLGNVNFGGNVFRGRIKCGVCGGWYSQKTWHSTDPYKSYVVQCADKYKKNKPFCPSPAIKVDELKRRFVAAFNSILDSKKPYLRACTRAKEALTDTTEIDAEMNALYAEMETVAGLTRNAVYENAAKPQDQADYGSRYAALVERYDAAKKRYEELEAEKSAKLSKVKAIEKFMREVKKRDGLLAEFDEQLWVMTVEMVTVMQDGKLAFRFYDGTEVMN